MAGLEGQRSTDGEDAQHDMRGTRYDGWQKDRYPRRQASQ